MSKVSLDIVDQSMSVHHWVLIEPITRPSSRNDKDWVENQPATEPDNRASLAVVVTGYNLLNIVSVLAFGVWKIISIGNEGWISLSKAEFCLILLAGVIMWYLQLLKEASPELCPGFFQIDLVPPIWNFLYRSEVYLLLLSLLPLKQAVAMLRSVLDARWCLELSNQSPCSHTAAQNALITAIMGIIFSILAIMQQLTKVLHLRVLYYFLVHDIMTLTLLVVWATSDCYVLINTVTSVEYNPKLDDEYLLSHTMTLIPFVLLLPCVQSSVMGILWFRVLKGVFILVMLVAWILSENPRNLYDVLFMCGIMAFFFLRFFASR